MHATEASLASEETKITSGSLIAAGKVERTDVYDMQDEKLGTVDDIMLDKASGKAIYAIMAFDGFLGIGEKYHPLPWSALKYDESKSGYLGNLDKQILENVPSYSMNEDFRWSASVAGGPTSTTTHRATGKPPATRQGAAPIEAARRRRATGTSKERFARIGPYAEAIVPNRTPSRLAVPYTGSKQGGVPCPA